MMNRENTEIHDNQLENGLHKKIWYKPTLITLQARNTLGGGVSGFGEGTNIHMAGSTYDRGTNINVS